MAPLNKKLKEINSREKARIIQLIATHKNLIEEVHQQNFPIEYKHDKDKAQTGFKDFADYVFSKCGYDVEPHPMGLDYKSEKQSFDDFGRRWMGLVLLIQRLKNIRNDGISIPQFINIIRSLVEKFARESACSEILKKLLPEQADEAAIALLKSQCETYLQALLKLKPLAFKYLNSWVDKNLDQEKQQAAAADLIYPHPAGMGKITSDRPEKARELIPVSAAAASSLPRNQLL